MKKNKRIITEAEISEQKWGREKAILESFSKGMQMLGEDYELNEADRIDMAEFFGDMTNNVDTLMKMFSKYQPNQSWFMNVGYANGVSLGVTIKNENMEELENVARQLNNDAFTAMINSEEWQAAKAGGKNFKSPYAAKTVNKVKLPTKVYTTKSFMIQWGNIRSKADKDAELKTVYDKHGLSWSDDGGIDPSDKRGLGWEPIQGTPFSQHGDTGTQRLAIYGKKEHIQKGKTKHFLNYEDKIGELSPEEANFIFSLSPKSYEKKMPKRLLDLENQEAAQEIFAMENTYDFKSLDLSKITYIRCAMEVNGENKKFSYVNKNVAPAGLNPGDLAEFINPF
jgi:hypothetical protein